MTKQEMRELIDEVGGQIATGIGVVDMGVRDRHYEEGPGLVESHENIMNRRETLYRLTPKGRALLASITKGGKP